MNPDHLPGAKILKDLHRLFRVSIRFAHEFARFLGPDGDGGEVLLAKALPRLGKIGTLAGVAGEIELLAIHESEHEPGPQRLVPVERRTRCPVPLGCRCDERTLPLCLLPPVGFCHIRNPARRK